LGKFTCRGILNATSDYIDRAVSKSVCKDIEEHLSTCRRCRLHIDAVELTIKLFDDWRSEEMPMDAEIRLRERLEAEGACPLYSRPSGADKAPRARTKRADEKRDSAGSDRSGK
jgi:hypothetical protein